MPAAFAVASDGLPRTVGSVEASDLGLVGGSGVASAVDMIVASGMIGTVEARRGVSNIALSAAGLGGSGCGTSNAAICIGGALSIAAARGGAGLVPATTATDWSGLVNKPAVPGAGWDSV